MLLIPLQNKNILYMQIIICQTDKLINLELISIKLRLP